MKLPRFLLRLSRAGTLTCALSVLIPNFIASAQETRKLLANPTPTYPDLARRMQITGVVKVQVIVGTDGKIKDTKFVGGHPLLVDAVQTTLKDWRYASASEETTLVLEFRFHP